MAQGLTAFLASYIDRPFVWGQDDCSLFLADWWKFRTGHDPAAHLRGTYSDEAGKNAVIETYGGLLSLVNGIAAQVEAKRVQAPHRGDFGIVSPGVGGIYCGSGFWVCRSETGLLYSKGMKPWRIWSA